MRRSFVIIATIGVLSLLAPHTGNAQVTASAYPATAAPLAGPDAANTPRIHAAMLGMPLHFEANGGQTDSEVKFLSRGQGYTLFLTPTEAVLALRSSEAKEKALEGTGSRQGVAEGKACPGAEGAGVRGDVAEAGACPRVEGTGAGESRAESSSVNRHSLSEADTSVLSP